MELEWKPNKVESVERESFTKLGRFLIKFENEWKQRPEKNVGRGDFFDSRKDAYDSEIVHIGKPWISVIPDLRRLMDKHEGHTN